MRRNWISRSLASVLSLWLAVCLAEPVQLHTCAMHGGLATVQSTPAGMQGHASAEHHATRVGAGHDHNDRNGDRESRQCSCLGDCNAGTAPVGIAAARVAVVPAVVAPSSPGAFDYASPRLVTLRFFLPFSNGPPAGSSRA